VKLQGSENWYKILDKGWLTAMSDPDIRTLAAQVNKFNINVNALSPGPINTKGQHRNAPPEKKLLVRDNPDCIKGVAIYLASQGPMGITGETVYSLTWDKIYLNRDRAT
jgi:enoyl-[acyl-carrier-protein] reductase (NADH)